MFSSTTYTLCFFFHSIFIYLVLLAYLYILNLISFHFRYLSTGLSFRALAFSFRMGKSTVANIVKETVEAIWDELYPLHMPIPTDESLKKCD